MTGAGRSSGLRRHRNLFFSIYVACCLGAVTWPGYAWLGNRIEPYVFGLPFSLAWVLGWVLSTLLALAAYHLSSPSSDGPADRRERS